MYRLLLWLSASAQFSVCFCRDCRLGFLWHDFLSFLVAKKNRLLMRVSDVSAMQAWLAEVLPPICSANPNILSKYIIALVQKDKPEADLRQICVSQLRIFLMDETDRFLDLLFQTLRTESYLSSVVGRKKEPSVDRPRKRLEKGGSRVRRLSSSPTSSPDSRARRKLRRRSPEEDGDGARKRRRSRRRRESPPRPQELVVVDQWEDRKCDPQPIQSVVQAVPHRGSGRARSPPPRRNPPAKPHEDPRRKNEVSSSSSSCSIEIRRVPAGHNNVVELGEHFSRFGRVLNVQVSHDGDPESALVTFSSSQEAEKAYRSSEPVLNNRFIRLSRTECQTRPQFRSRRPPNSQNYHPRQPPAPTQQQTPSPPSQPTNKFAARRPTQPGRYNNNNYPPAPPPPPPHHNRFTSPHLFNKKNEVVPPRPPFYDQIKEDYDVLHALMAEQKQMFKAYEKAGSDESKNKISEALSEVMKLVEQQNSFVQSKIKELSKKDGQEEASSV